MMLIQNILLVVFFSWLTHAWTTSVSSLYGVPMKHYIQTRITMIGPLDTIKLVVDKKNVERTDVIRAVQLLEHKGTTTNFSGEDMNGKWECVFTNAPNAFEGGFLVGGVINGYFVTKEVLEIDLSRSTIELQGPLWSRYKGSCNLTADKNGIEYQFKDFKVGPIGQDGMGILDRSYNFIHLDGSLAVARIGPTRALAILKKLRS